MLTKTVPLVPKASDGTAQIIIMGRISTIQQDKENIAASYVIAERFLAQIHQGPMEIKHLGEQASGLLADRPTFVAAQELIQSGKIDLVICEDISRIHRNPRYLWAFVQDAVDNGTRVIAIHDNLDTADDDWEVAMNIACTVHGLQIPQTRRRVRRTASNTFDHGGMVLKIKFGYRKLTKEEAASGTSGPIGLRIAKRPENTPFIREMKDRVMLNDDSYVVIAEWLNDIGMSPGPYVKTGKWTDRLVKELLRDPILSGQRTFRDYSNQPVYGTGKSRRRRNQAGPERKQYAELAHLTPQEHAELLAFMDARKEGHNQRSGRDNPLFNRPRARSLWPGQHARCGACGGLMYRSGKFLKCENVLPQGPKTCWCHMQVYYHHVYQKVLRWVLEVLERHPPFKEQMIDAAWREFQQRRQRSVGSLTVCDGKIAELEKDARNLARAIRTGGQLEALLDELKTVQSSLDTLRRERQRLASQAEDGGHFLSRAGVAARLDEAIFLLAETSLDFADLMRRLLPTFVVQPVQALDCPLVRPRAHLTLSLGAWAEHSKVSFTASTELDMFEAPQHILHLQACLTAKQSNPDMMLKQIAQALAIGHMTVKRALGYANLMQKEGLSTPYRQLLEKPERASRWIKRPKKADDSAA